MVKYSYSIGRQLSVKLLFVICCLLFAPKATMAQVFFNLTADEVRIDSVLPCFHYSQPLGVAYADSLYEVTIDYPEFIDMTEADVARYQAVTDAPLPEMPEVNQYVGVSQKRGTLYVSFVPLVFRDGHYQKLVSFQLTVKGRATQKHLARASSDASDSNTKRYASHSVLSSGTWAKIRVSETGIHQLTDAVVRKAGFSDPKKVKIYGYGGAMQPEKLTADYLVATDDLKEVPTCTIGGRRLFYAVGPVNWADGKASTVRERNPYSNYGYYFLTENDSAALSIDSATFVRDYTHTANDYRSHYEVDNYAWYHGGRNLYDSKLFGTDVARSYTLPAYSANGTLVVAMSYAGDCEAKVAVNDSVVGTIKVTRNNGKAYPDSYSAAAVDRWSFELKDSLLKDENTITIRQISGGDMRLDYITIVSNSPKTTGDLGATSWPTPEYVYHITNQDLHADPQADMVIIIPTTQAFRSEAERLKAFHQTRDGMRVNIVPADELYNEFSSGTPDANAYRRYMKMLYDRAENDEDLPRYLLLFGDGAWDNRMLSSNWHMTSPDDFLLCYESENSFSEVSCYVCDDYFCLLDDNEGGSVLSDKFDAAVGRLSARTPAEAKILVDKIIAYDANEQAGAWQNIICMMGDDGDNNLHMNDAEYVYNSISTAYPDYQYKKIYWDAYTRVASSTGYSFPDVTRLIRQQMQSGALIMNYSGHGAAYCLSHEQVVKLADFNESSSMRLPLWLTASCDIMPFDGQEENIGETAMLNKNGGAIAFYGTTRTVYASYNRPMNQLYTNYVLSTTADGKRMTIGEAARLAKNSFTAGSTAMLINKLQYTLLGDPALSLATPTLQVVIDSVNGLPVSAGRQALPAGSSIRVSGHVEGRDDFNGVATLTVYDKEETIVGHKYAADAVAPITFKDRPNIVYSGSDSISNGHFSFVFVVPMDVSYSDQTGLMSVFAVNDSKTLSGHGKYEDFVLSETGNIDDDGIGPSIYCYLNSESFVNGGKVNATPFFVARLTDKDGINAAGNGIGHDLELVIDGQMSLTYNLNNCFTYDFGDYRNGMVGFSIPTLSDGQHRLLFRAWDMLNNSSTAELTFTVDAKLEPTLFNVVCTKNPATTSTRFIISHDRAGSQMDVELEVFDTSGRKLWGKTETGVPTDYTYVIDWDLTTGSGSRLRTGVYLYRVLVSNNGSTKASIAKKLIVL